MRLEGRTLSALLKEHELLRLSKALVRHEYEPGATVIEEGAVGNTFFMVKTGTPLRAIWERSGSCCGGQSGHSIGLPGGYR